jgi:gliding motility-associated protein GldM
MVDQKKGDDLLKKITETRQAFLNLISDPAERKTIEALIPLQADSIASDSKAKTWSEYKFGHMPVGAVLAILSKNVADAKTSETALMNHFFNKMSIQDIKFDKFRVAIAPKKSYLIRGDKFEADMFVAAFSSNPAGNVSIAVNGGGQSLKDGVAHYETTPSSLGKQTITVTGSVKNALTGETTTATPSTFEYEVGERSGSVSAEKMNVLYIGVDNPIEVTAAGVSSNSLNATGTNVTLTKKDANHYNARVSKVGEAIITLTGENGFSFPKKFRVKRIPDPVAKLLVGGDITRGGIINSGTMAAAPGLQAELENFDFEARCNISSYTVVINKRNEDPIAKQGTGNAFSGEIKSALSSVRGGDKVFIFDIKSLCPGDDITRKIGTMNFVIK